MVHTYTYIESIDLILCLKETGTTTFIMVVEKGPGNICNMFYVTLLTTAGKNESKICNKNLKRLYRNSKDNFCSNASYNKKKKKQIDTY